MHEGSLSVYLAFIAVQKSLIMENPMNAVGLAVLRSQFLMKIHFLQDAAHEAMREASGPTTVHYGEILAQEPLYKVAWCLQVCSDEPIKYSVLIGTLLKELYSLAKYEMNRAESYVLGELGHLLKHPAFQVTIFRLLVFLAAEISSALSVAFRMSHGQVDQEEPVLSERVLEWPRLACEKLEDFSILYRMILLSESYLSMWSEGLYFLPDIPINMKDHTFYNIFFRYIVAGHSDSGPSDDLESERMQVSLDIYYPQLEEVSKKNAENICFESFTNLGVQMLQKETILNFLESCKSSSLYQKGPDTLEQTIGSPGGLTASGSSLTNRGAATGPMTSLGIFNFEKTLFLTLLLDWIVVKPLDDVRMRNNFRLALQIPRSIQEIQFWESFIERCVKYRYEEPVLLLPYILDLFLLLDGNSQDIISQGVKLKSVEVNQEEIQLMQALLGGCRRMLPQWTKKQVSLIVVRIVQRWKERYQEYPMMFEDLKWIIQFSQ